MLAINLYRTCHCVHKSEVLPAQDTQREESSLERTKRDTWHTS